MCGITQKKDHLRHYQFNAKHKSKKNNVFLLRELSKSLYSSRVA